MIIIISYKKILVILFIIFYIKNFFYVKYCNKFFIYIYSQECRCLNYYLNNPFEFNTYISKKCIKYYPNFIHIILYNFFINKIIYLFKYMLTFIIFTIFS